MGLEDEINAKTNELQDLKSKFNQEIEKAKLMVDVNSFIKLNTR
jgi:hypothetical protein